MGEGEEEYEKKGNGRKLGSHGYGVADDEKDFG